MLQTRYQALEVIIIIINICSAHQVVVLMCGTNNHDHSTEQVTDAILTIVRYIILSRDSEAGSPTNHPGSDKIIINICF